jgi:hypothetical protein
LLFSSTERFFKAGLVKHLIFSSQDLVEEEEEEEEEEVEEEDQEEMVAETGLPLHVPVGEEGLAALPVQLLQVVLTTGAAGKEPGEGTSSAAVGQPLHLTVIIWQPSPVLSMTIVEVQFVMPATVHN